MLLKYKYLSIKIIHFDKYLFQRFILKNTVHLHPIWVWDSWHKENNGNAFDFSCCDTVAFVRFPSLPLVLVPRLGLQAGQHVGTIDSIPPERTSEYTSQYIYKSQRIYFP